MCGCAGLDPCKAWNQTGRRVKGQRPLSGKGLKALCWFPHRVAVYDKSDFTRWGEGASRQLGKQHRFASIQQKRERLWRSLSYFARYLLYTVSGIVHTEFEHWNKKRVTAVCSLSVLGKAVRLVQSVTIPAPVDIIVLLRVFALAFGLLDFPRNQPTDDFLTLCQRFHPLSTTDRPRLRTSAATAWAWWMLPRLLRSGCAALRNCGGKVAGRANGWDTTPEKGLSGLFSDGLRPRITVIQLYAIISKK